MISIIEDDVDPDAAKEKLISKQHRAYRAAAVAKVSTVQENLKDVNRAKFLGHVERELKDMELGLCVARNRVYQDDDARLIQTVQRQIKRYESLNRRIDDARIELESLKLQLKRLCGEQSQMCKATVSDVEHTRNLEQAAENVRRLENKLYTMNVRYGAASTVNRRLRELAKEVLRERMTFGYRFQQMIDQLGTRKKILIDTFEHAVLALDGGAQLCKQIMAEKGKAAEDLQRHVNDMMELMEDVQINDQKYEFFASKGRLNIVRELNVNEQKRREMFREAHSKKIEQFRSVVIAVSKATNEYDYIDAIKNFNKSESQFLSYFEYLNDLNLHMEQMIQGEWKKPTSHAGEMRDDQLQCLKADQQRKKQEEEHNLEALETTVKGFFERIQRMFIVLGCEKRATSSIVDVNIGNYNSCLASIESRLKEIISQVYYAERLKGDQRPDEYIVRDVKVTDAKPYDRHTLTHLVNQCAECLTNESIVDGVERVPPLNNAQLLQTIKDTRPDLIHHRMHHIAACPDPRCQALLVKHLQNS